MDSQVRLQGFQERIAPLVQALRDVSLEDPAAAREQLDRMLPISGDAVRAVRVAAEEGVRDGWLVPKEIGGMRFGRVAKDLDGFSVDVVVSSSAGPRHRHPNGEIDLLFSLDGEPRFDGHEPGWAVYEPGSEHVPGVEGGTMLIVYFLPDGAIDWL